MTRSTLHNRAFTGIIILSCLVPLAACSRGGTPVTGGGGATVPAAAPGTGGAAPAPTATEEPLRSDIPIIEGAQVERAARGVVEYRVPMELSKVVEFYQKELPAQGWEESSRPSLLQFLATLRYAKEEEGKEVNLTVGLQYNENSQTTLVRLFWQ